MGSTLPADLSLLNLCLRGVRLLDPWQQRDEVTDVWLQQGRLRATEPAGIPADIPRLEAAGWVLGPGLIDLYAHSGEIADQELSPCRETLASLGAAALAGGLPKWVFSLPPCPERQLSRCWTSRSRWAATAAERGIPAGCPGLL